MKIEELSVNSGIKLALKNHGWSETQQILETDFDKFVSEKILTWDEVLELIDILALEERREEYD